MEPSLLAGRTNGIASRHHDRGHHDPAPGRFRTAVQAGAGPGIAADLARLRAAVSRRARRISTVFSRVRAWRLRYYRQHAERPVEATYGPAFVRASGAPHPGARRQCNGYLHAKPG